MKCETLHLKEIYPFLGGDGRDAVLDCRADVADKTQVATMLTQAEKAFGPGCFP